MDYHESEVAVQCLQRAFLEVGIMVEGGDDTFDVKSCTFDKVLPIFL